VGHAHVTKGFNNLLGILRWRVSSASNNKTLMVDKQTNAPSTDDFDDFEEDIEAT
jgi:hypothetical protein